MCDLIGIGDLHLTDDKGTGGLAKYIPDPDRYVMSEVNRVLKWATAKNITYVILYGDVCDGPRMSYQAHEALRATIKGHPHLKFYIILGNHDKVGPDSSLGHSLQLLALMELPNLRVISEDTVLKIQGIPVKFCPWPSTQFNRKMLNIGHIEVKGSKGDSGRIMEDPDLSSDKAVICMGHLHTNHQVRNTYFSGTLYQTNFGESLPKFFHHIRWAGLEDYEIESVPFAPKYKLHNCVAESQADVDALSKDPHDLIKLVIKDGADVVVPDLPNIVITKAFKTKAELATILTEDLITGSELVVKTSDYFKEWIAAQSIPLALKVQTRKLRREILSQA